MPKYSRRFFLRSAGFTGLALALPRMAAAGPVPFFRETRLCMGTFVHIQLGASAAKQLDTASAKVLLAGAFARIDALENIFSRYRSHSSLAQLNSNAVLENTPSALLTVLQAAKVFEEQTEGAFSLSVAQLVDLYKAGMSNTEALAKAQTLALAGAWEVQGHTSRISRQDARLSLDGIAKGYIVDAISQYLAENGATAHLIDAGGDIMAKGEKAPGHAWRVGIQHPAKPNTALFTLPLRDRALATSGTYQQDFGAGKSHLIAAPGIAPMLSASVLAHSAMQADALATSLCVLPALQGSALIQQEAGEAAFLLDAKGKATRTGILPV